MKSLSSILLIVLLVSGFVLVCNLNFGAAQDSTEVGGIIQSDVTMSIENSPYSITSTLQIPENVTLKIDPGVTVTFNSTDSPMFLVHGRVEAHGTPSNKVTIIGIERSFFFDMAGAPSDCSVSLDYCVLKHGLGICQNIGGSLNLTNSEIIDLADPGWAGGYSWSWGLESEIYIEHNMFIEVMGFRLDWTKENIYIRYNLFKGNNGFILDESAEFGGQSRAVIKYNTFIGMSEPILKFYVGGNQTNMSATENYWGTTNTSLIDSLIIDENDAITIHGFVEYLPLLTEPHPDTPTLPITASFEYSPAAVYAYGEVNFDANASFAEYSQIANYTWDFGDGTVTTTESPTINHTYLTPSSYNIGLTVTDEFGFKDSTTTRIVVLQDVAPPVTEDNYDGLWHNEDVNITLIATDQESGVAETYYRINDGTTKTVSANGQPLITTEGVDNTLEYWSIDNVGNLEAAKTETVKVDKTAPFGSVQINENIVYTNVTSVTLTLSANDKISGVAQMHFSNNETEWSSWEPYATSKAWTLTAENGEKTVYVQFKDNADLVSETYQDSIILDTIKPTADAGQNQTVKVDTIVTFNSNASSDNLDIVSYEWDFGDGTTGSGETATHTYTSEGTYTVTLTVKDATGNAGTHQITVTVQSDVLLLLLIIGVAAIAVAVTAVFLWKKRKSTHKNKGSNQLC
jgi:PKD repeat protein